MSKTSSVSELLLFSLASVATSFLSAWLDTALAACFGMTPAQAQWATLLYSLIPVAIVVGYALLARNRSRDMNAAGDQVYFLGYLCTVTALCGLVVRLGIDTKATNNPQTVLLPAGVAISTIIVGLVGMSILKLLADESPADSAALESVRHIIDSPELRGGVVRLFNEAVNSTFTTMLARISALLEQAPANLDRLQRSADLARQAVTNLNGELGEFGGIVARHDRAAADFNRKLTEMFTHLNDVRGLLNDDRLRSSLAALDEIMSALRAHTGGANRELQELVANVQQVKGVLDDFEDIKDRLNRSGARQEHRP